MIVQHNLTAMSSNRLLGLTTSAQAKSTEKLSSGYKINRAADDAAGLSISEKMRKQIRGLTQASSNAQDGISAVQTAEGALTEVHAMLQRMNELAVKAANGTNSEDDRQNIQDEIAQLKTEIDRVAETTKFNETYLLKGDISADETYEISYNTAKVPASATITNTVYDASGNSYAAGADEAALATYLEANPDAKIYNADPTAAGRTASVAGTDYTHIAAAFVNGGVDATSVFVLGGADDLLDPVNKELLADAIKNGTTLYKDGTTQTDAEKVTLKAGTNTVTITNPLYDLAGNELSEEEALYLLNAGKTADIFTDKPSLATKADFTYTPESTPALYDMNGNKIAANGLENYFDIAEDGSLSYKEGKKLYTDANRAELKADDINDYIGTAQSGTAALTLNLHVGADATLNNQIELKIRGMDTAAIGISDITVIGEDDTNARDAIDTIKFAIQRVSNQRSMLGATQNRLEHTITNLDNVVENTTVAESQIRDTDMASEMVKYSNNNILTQAGQAMLAQANQSNQGVLSLLQ